MKAKKKILILLFCTVFLLTGCAKTLNDANKKPVKNEITGQNLIKNILCKPVGEDVEKLYIENGVNIDSLPTCEEFRITSGGYEGMWTSLFVKPLAWIIVKIGSILKNYGLAVIVITLLIRLVIYPITRKTALQSEMLKKAQPELTKLEKKYQNKASQEAQMQKAQEMMLIYKKYKINPLSGCLFAFIQIPLFFAFYEALNRLPAIFEGKLFMFQLGTTPLTGLKNGHFFYILLVLLVILTTYFSFKLNATASMSKEQQQQMKIMSIVMISMISITSFTMATSICLYWITNSAFTIIQNILVKRSKKNDNII